MAKRKKPSTMSRSQDPLPPVISVNNDPPPFCQGQCEAVKFVVASYEVLLDSYSSRPARFCEQPEQEIQGKAGNAIQAWIRNNSSYRLIRQCQTEGCECADDSFVEHKVWTGDRFWRYEWSTDYIINGELGVCYHHVTIRVALEKWRATGECVPRNGLLLPHGSEYY